MCYTFRNCWALFMFYQSYIYNWILNLHAYCISFPLLSPSERGNKDGDGTGWFICLEILYLTLKSCASYIHFFPDPFYLPQALLIGNLQSCGLSYSIQKWSQTVQLSFNFSQVTFVFPIFNILLKLKLQSMKETVVHLTLYKTTESLWRVNSILKQIVTHHTDVLTSHRKAHIKDCFSRLHQT